MSRYTGCKDRNGKPINVGDVLKWIRDDRFFKTGPKKGELKQGGSEFIAGRVVKLNEPDYPFWCKDLKANDEKDKFSRLPAGLNFMAMLEYIEVVP